MRGRLWLCSVLDADSGRRRSGHTTVLNGFVGDPLGRLLREAARGLGRARPEDIQLRYMPRNYTADMFLDFSAAWDFAVELTPGAVDWTRPYEALSFIAKSREQRAAQPPTGNDVALTTAPPPPQRVDAVTPDGFRVYAAFSRTSDDPLADLTESVANAGRFCTDDGLELRAVTGALPRLERWDQLLPAHAVRELWERGTPLFPDRMPALGQAVVGRFVDVPGLPPPETRCGACLW
jgi:hypothetical protein